MKFEIGDRVRITCNKNTIGNYSGKGRGYEFVIGEVFRGKDIWYRENKEVSTGIQACHLELATPKWNGEYPVIVHCPTKKFFEMVQGKAFKDGYGWRHAGKNLVDEWHLEREETCIRISDRKIGHGSKAFYKGNPEYNCFPIISAQEYLNQVLSGTLVNTFDDEEKSKPQKKNTMSIIKNAFKSTEQKALANFDITNGDGGLTENGKDEWTDYLWEILKEEKKGFIEKIVAEYKEAKKK